MMPKKNSMLAAVAAIILFGSVAEIGFAQPRFPPGPPVGFRPFRIGKAVVNGSRFVGKVVVRPIGKAARGIGRIGSTAARGVGSLGYKTLIIGGRPYYYYSQLPIGYRTVRVGTQRYYVYDNVYYSPYNYRGSIIYIVTPPPYPPFPR